VLTDRQRGALSHAIDLFNEGEYFECHEVLEEPWREAAEPDRTFLKGLIHAAVSLYQYQRGNSHGARVKAASCRRYLAPYLPAREGIDLQSLLHELDGIIAPLHAQHPKSAPPPPDGPWPRMRLPSG
jgi:predicted metal-dependent hydrolase